MNTGTTWQIADRYMEGLAARRGDPRITLPDISIEGYDERYQLRRRVLADLDALPRLDLLGRVMHERFTADVAMDECGFNTSLLAPLFTPVHRLRMVFDDLPHETEEDWRIVLLHLRTAAEDYRHWARTLATSLERGGHIAKRQVRVVAAQCLDWIDPAGTNFYRALVAGFVGNEQLGKELDRAAQEVTRATAEFADFLLIDLLPKATDRDAVGRDMYATTSRTFVGKSFDLEALYDYGWSELHRLHAEARELGLRLTGEKDLAAARDELDKLPEFRLAVGDELVGWLQSRLDDASGILFPEHFDILEKYSRLEAKMSTAASIVMYYGMPDESGERPGRVWWAVPPGVTSVPSWRQISTVFHEGLPGHHLQFTTAMGTEGLHPWQRTECSSHAYSEGWAHYAERTSIELGLLRHDAEHLDVIDAQLWRVARIVIDLGLHLELPIPRGNGFIDAERWTPAIGTALLAQVAGVDRAMAASEVDRYLGWPGQALVFKVGSDSWASAREAERARLGSAFDLKEFHMSGLRYGPMGLETFESLYGDQAKENHEDSALRIE